MNVSDIMNATEVLVSCKHDFMQIVPRITGEETGWRHHIHPRVSRLLQSLGPPGPSRPAPLLRDVSLCCVGMTFTKRTFV